MINALNALLLTGVYVTLLNACAPKETVTSKLSDQMRAETPTSLVIDHPSKTVEEMLKPQNAKGDAARATLATQLAQNETDTRLSPLLNSCKTQPVGYPYPYDLISAGYTDTPTEAYPQTLFFQVAARDSSWGGISLETIFYPIKTFNVTMLDERGIEVSSSAEDVSGVTSEINPDGNYGASYDFQEVSVDKKFYCADPEQATTFLQVLQTSLQSDTAPPNSEPAVEPETLPQIRYSVTFPRSDINLEGMCEYMHNDAKDRIKLALIRARLDPILQIAEAPNNDLRIVLPEYPNHSDVALNECRFDMDIYANWTPDNLNPIPARNQNYETGYELIDDGMLEIVDSYKLNLATRE
ncbi:MAG: hypothetical protein ABJ275_10005 [Maricaulaceae bacterium]